jgi:hypothetical protein
LTGMIHPFYSVSCESPLDTALSRTSHGSEHTAEPVAESSARRRIQAVHRSSFAPFAGGGVLARPDFPSTAIFRAGSMDGAVIRARRVGAQPWDSRWLAPWLRPGVQPTPLTGSRWPQAFSGTLQRRWRVCHLRVCIPAWFAPRRNGSGLVERMDLGSVRRLGRNLPGFALPGWASALEPLAAGLAVEQDCDAAVPQTVSG